MLEAINRVWGLSSSLNLHDVWISPKLLGTDKIDAVPLWQQDLTKIVYLQNNSFILIGSARNRYCQPLAQIPKFRAFA